MLINLISIHTFISFLPLPPFALHHFVCLIFIPLPFPSLIYDKPVSSPARLISFCIYLFFLDLLHVYCSSLSFICSILITLHFPFYLLLCYSSSLVFLFSPYHIRNFISFLVFPFSCPFYHLPVSLYTRLWHQNISLMINIIYRIPATALQSNETAVANNQCFSS
jgi:hypothetical protein